MTKLSALPPAAVTKDASQSSTNGSVNGEAPSSTEDSTSGSARSLADMTRRELAQERRSLLMRLFANTGTAKIPGVVRYVRPRMYKGNSCGSHGRFSSLQCPVHERGHGGNSI